MITEDVEERLVGATVLDRSETPIGEVCRAFVDTASERLRWASVRLPGAGPEVLVPLDDADWDEEAVRLAVGEASVASAPRRRGGAAPTSGEEQRLLFHYGIPSVRLPRDAGALLGLDAAPVSYSVRDRESAVDAHLLAS